MKVISLVLTCLLVGFVSIITPSRGQTRSQGIGLRMGDPLGVTYKSYFDNRAALELVLGSTSGNRHGRYYKRNFDKRDKFNGYSYVDHVVDYTVALQGRLLIHDAFPANVEGRLDWFWGVGAHLRMSDIDYRYLDENNVIRSDGYTNFDLGPEGILGAEYELLDYPIVVFSEVSLMGELIDNPFRFRLFGAIGIRYAF